VPIPKGSLRGQEEVEPRALGDDGIPPGDAGFAFDERTQGAAIEFRVGAWEAGVIEEGGVEVAGADETVIGPAGAWGGLAGGFDEERDAVGLLIHEEGLVGESAVDTEGIAVVGGENDERVLVNAPSFQVGEQAADLGIEFGDGREIHAQGAFEVRPAPVARGLGAVSVVEGWFSGLVLVEGWPGRDGQVAVEIEKLGGSVVVGVRSPVVELVVERRARIEVGVDVAEGSFGQEVVDGGVGAGGHLKNPRVGVVINAGLEAAAAGGEPGSVLGSVDAYAAVTGEVVPLVADGAGEGAVQGNAAEAGAGGDVRLVFRLVNGIGSETEVPFSGETGPVAERLEATREQGGMVGQLVDLAAPVVDVVLHAVAEREKSGLEGRAGGGADRAGGVGVVEEESVAREGVEMGRAAKSRAIGTQRGGEVLVGKDEKQVRTGHSGGAG